MHPSSQQQLVVSSGVAGGLAGCGASSLAILAANGTLVFFFPFPSFRQRIALLQDSDAASVDRSDIDNDSNDTDNNSNGSSTNVADFARDRVTKSRRVEFALGRVFQLF